MKEEIKKELYSLFSNKDTFNLAINLVCKEYNLFIAKSTYDSTTDSTDFQLVFKKQSYISSFKYSEYMKIHNELRKIIFTDTKDPLWYILISTDWDNGDYSLFLRIYYGD